MKTLIKNIAILFFTMCILMSCKKDWLEAKPNKILVVPSTIKDLQALLDNNTIINNREPELGAYGCDDYYLPTIRINAAGPYQRNAYLWNSEIFEGRVSSDWVNSYKIVEYANNALDGIKKIPLNAENKDGWNNVKGSALFYRAWVFYNLSQLFMKPYDVNTSSTDLGIPLKLIPSLEELSKRGTAQQVYDRIVTDLSEAIDLLPSTQKVNAIYRPNKQTAHALLSRVFLTSANYESALNHANECLKYPHTLLDFNGLAGSLVFNSEVLYMSGISTVNGIRYAQIDSNLFTSYDLNDLRRTVFFNYNTTTRIATFKGSYKSSTNTSTFNGIATDEMYLIRAECYARINKLTEAASDLNTLLKKRYKSGFFPDIVATSQEQILKLILEHRRKELVLRGLRWSDLRRLNKEGANITAIRIVDGKSYTLPPNDNRYIYPIPPDEIQLSGLEQNIR